MFDLSRSGNRPALALVTDRSRVPGEDLVPVVSAAVDGGVDLVILREKDLPAGPLLALAEQLRAVLAGRAWLVVSDRVDVALSSGADGAQLGDAGLPVGPARSLAAGRPGLLLGRSVHEVDEACRAAAEGADYLIFGNVFETTSHPGRPAAGLERLSEVAAAVNVPVVAIGGITKENAGECVRAGAAGVAVISAILDAPDPAVAAGELVAAMQAVRGGG